MVPVNGPTLWWRISSLYFIPVSAPFLMNIIDPYTTTDPLPRRSFWATQQSLKRSYISKIQTISSVECGSQVMDWPIFMIPCKLLSSYSVVCNRSWVCGRPPCFQISFIMHIPSSLVAKVTSSLTCSWNHATFLFEALLWSCRRPVL